MATAGTRAPNNSLNLTFGRSQEKLPLVETMQLVEPRKEIPVPNHLLDSQIYTKVGQNGMLKVRPSVVHFAGFQLGETQTIKLHLLNTALDIQRMHLIPPQTKYFDIKYTKQNSLRPGDRLECYVQFKPDEWRYYYDCVRIHSEAENLLIPIHAYPVMSGLDFPKQLNFAPVPIGETKTKLIPLRCNVPIDFEFQLCYVRPHPAFVVQPMTGVVPANGQQDISVTFTPTQFNTCSLELQLTISQFQARPLTCRILGSSEPFLKRDDDDDSRSDVILDPQRVSPIDVARSKRALRGKVKSDKKQKIPQTISEMTIPDMIDSHHAVSQVLLQKSGKLSFKDLKKAVRSTTDTPTGQQTKQMKEAMFQSAVQSEIHEERQNQLRWQVKLGGAPISDNNRDEIARNRERDVQIYKLKYGEVFVGDEYSRSKTICSFDRTKRDASQVAEEVAKFDTLSNNMWHVRYDMITRFRAAARKVIYRRRAATRLVLLKKLTNKVKAMTSEADEGDLISMDEQKKLANPATLTPLASNRVKSMTFPTYVDPSMKDDMAVDAIGLVPYMPVEITLKKRVPYFDLKVPQQYQLMSYKPRCTHEDSLSFIAPPKERTLRTGAVDEIIKVSVPVTPDKMPPSPPARSPVIKGQVPADDAEKSLIPLVPPEVMLRNMKRHPLHIFNASPGVQVFHPPMDYSDIDNDYHLCPLPRFPGNKPWLPQMSTQRKFLSREELITGTMTWKRFPSQGLTSLSQTPTLTNVWVPRWSDAFGSDLMPHAVPELYDGLPDEDARVMREEMQLAEAEREPDADEEEESSVLLTPEMIRAEFDLDSFNTVTPTAVQEKGRQSDMFPEGKQMPATNIPMSASGPVPQEKRELELDYFLKRKYNKLGARIQAHIQNYDGLKTDPNLVLK